MRSFSWIPLELHNNSIVSSDYTIIFFFLDTEKIYSDYSDLDYFVISAYVHVCYA